MNGYQLALFNIELPGFINHPFMVAVTTERLALVLFLQGGFTKRNDISHCCEPTRLQ